MDVTKLLLAASATVLVTAPTMIEAMPPAEDWEIGPLVRGRNYSIGTPAHPQQQADGSLTMDFPVAGTGQVDAWTVPVRSLRGARQITLTYRIDAAEGTRFVPDEARGQPATVSLYIQRRGDNWSAKGRYGSYRWYVPARAVIPLTPGRHTITVRFDEDWTNVWGRTAQADPDGFAAALADAGRVGIAFGSRGLRSHGVYATGPARFTLLALDID